MRLTETNIAVWYCQWLWHICRASEGPLRDGTNLLHDDLQATVDHDYHAI